MDKFLLVAFACLAGVSITLAADAWSYDNNAVNGPSYWGGLCDGRSQSPIDIKTNMTQYDSALDALILTGYSTKPAVNFTAKNSGYTLKVGFPSYLYNVSGGGLPGTYTTVQFHLHWGSVNSKGSEHAVDGELYPAEIHFVSFNTKYPDINTALNQSDGLAVLGVFIKVGNGHDAAYEEFLTSNYLPVNKSTKMNDIPPFELDKLLPTDKSKYFRYNGSLTTPTCNEAVTWTVFKDPVEISEAKLNMLRSLKMNNTISLVDNFRPLQVLNNRTVKASFEDTETLDDSQGIALKVSNAVFLLMLFGALFMF